MYGQSIDMFQLNTFLKSSIKFNKVLEEQNLPREVLCIWGPPGIGKTSCIKQLGTTGYDVIDLPVAQFEEMGDFAGMPDIEDKVTVMRPPHWVPQAERDGIILFDDFNRSSTRIIKGMMQILQDYRTIHWSIPKGYTIVLTGNPDNAEFLVTTIDSAILTRMKHVTLQADPKAWAAWAEHQKLNGNCINFILAHTEQLYCGMRTNPRSLTQWFRYITHTGIAQDKLNDISIHGEASVDGDVVSSFLTFLREEDKLYIEPLALLNHYDEHRSTFQKYIKNNRVDVMSIMLERIKNVVTDSNYKPTPTHGKNMRAVLKDCKGTADLVYTIIQQIIGANPGCLEMLINDKELADLVKGVAM